MTSRIVPLPESGLPVKLSQPALRALEHAGYSSLEQLTLVRASELAKLHGMGPKGIDMLREALAARGLDFAK
ncbi:DNA-binding protein [Paenibacillus sp. FSL R7-0273]|uniref:DNA-binding protein n=1 Tax=Paenibacillus sp. FSL R7-0273 TaxID=1536772 RepID=UPI0004F6FB3B|nr:DNA-binding protein [Paenibacillus sp. FSL R7-0273]AIQ46824.1 DNA-binding protein [Paenibacillus sp. FSL R7-0273]OMF97409.1 DNA-binding protein [Paenibacillus sp. FSL R7-0273]